jgi:predicted nucleotidyltransferase
MKYKKLLSYVQDFVSFLTFSLHEDLFREIRRIVLFGSVSRREATKKSDIDLFIEVSEKGREIEEAVDQVMDKFYESQKFTKYWKLLGIDNPISCKFGTLSEWKDLYSSILQDGIILYGKHGREAVEGSLCILISWENVKPESKRVMLNRKLFGYTKNGKTYSGYVSRHNAKKISKGALLVPIEHRKVFETLFHTYKITVKIHFLTDIEGFPTHNSVKRRSDS